MKNINLDKYSPFHKTGHTSKGDQRKWEIDGIWYKADYMGYESLAEVLVSRLLKKSSLKYAFVTYDLTKIEYNNSSINACVSQDFRKEGQVLIPLEKLFRQYTGESLAVKLAEFADVRERIRYLVEQVENITGIKSFGEYITEMIEIDAFFLNEDRHTNNIAVLYDEENEQYFVSPFFDQGLCLLADTRQDYPMELSIEQCMDKIEAKPFSSEFDTQLEAAEELFGTQLEFHFTIQDIHRELEELADFYPEDIRQRVELLMRQQMRKYSYLITK
ncbi:hypothetical protein OCV70_00675 [Blautia acetigignens]|uniref:HipA-like C-terminal domain-containing protein n=1 Tax=Blautia acetigignens TaxID=2981783 RepID=A0ABV1CMV7_9FIRM|nr:hypothetical protein [Blautia acetigignens]MCU6773166.1 hypothetical protein [Blautia acetigignens]